MPRRKGGYHVEVTRSAANDLSDLPAPERRQILQGALTLERDPAPRGSVIKRLRGFRPPVYRLRVGDYRLLFRIRDEVVYLLRVINRKDLERALRRLT